MKCTAFTPNAVQLTRYGAVNCYLVRESDGFSLIDTGLPDSADSILLAAESEGAPIRRVLLTHAHGDQVGSVDALLARLRAPTLFAASERTLPFLQQPPDRSLRPGEPHGKIKGVLPGTRNLPNHILAPGELFGSLRVLDTPGHIPGHLSFLDERDGTLFAGDAIVTFGGVTFSGYAPWYFPLPNLATWNKATALASARKLLDFPIERYAPSHGPIREGGLAPLRAALDGASR